MTLLLARSRRHRGLLGALLGASAVIAALAVVGPVLIADRADAGVRGEFAERSGDDRALRLTLPLAADAGPQDAGVRRALARDLVGVDAAIEVARSVESRVELGVDGTVISAEALSIDDATSRVEFASGDAPQGDGLAMRVDDAAALGLALGDTVTLDGAPFSLTGTWRAVDERDPRWTDADLVAAGSGGDRRAVALIDESAWSRLPEAARATWSVIPQSDQLTTADLATIPLQWSLLSGSLRDELGTLEDLARTGRFTTTAAEAASRVAGLRAIEPVVGLLTAALALASLGQLARLLVLARRDETRLRWSRGARASALVGGAALEALLVGLAGSLLGAAAAVAALSLGGAALGTPALVATIAAVSGIPLAAALLAAAPTASMVRRMDAAAAAPARRGLGAAGWGLTALLTAAAALSTWQLLLYGSPLTPDASGELSVDPVTVAAPALVLIAAVLLAAGLAPRLARLLDRRRPRASSVAVLSVAAVARRPEVTTATATTAALAVASIVLAAGYAASWSLAADRSAQSRAGSTIAASSAAGIGVDAVSAARAIPAVAGVAALHAEDVQIDGAELSLVGVAPEALRDLASPGALARADATAESLRGTVPGALLAVGSERLAITAAVSGFAIPPAAVARVVDGYGAMRTIALEVESSEPGTVAYAAALPAELRDAPPPWRLIAVETTIAVGSLPTGGTGGWSLLSLRSGGEGAEGAGAAAGGESAEGEVALGASWLPVAEDPAIGPLPSGDGRGYEVDARARSVRLAAALDLEASIPIVISQALADSTSAGIGDRITLRSVGTAAPLATSVVAVVEAVPSATGPLAVMLDLGVVQALQVGSPAAVPRPALLWVDADDAATTGEAVRGLLPAGARIDDEVEAASRSALGAGALVLWVIAGGAAVLAVITVGSSVAAQRRERRGESVVLRALGADARAQGAIRRREVILAAAAGVLGGALAGAVVVLATVAPFARAAIPVGSPLVAAPLALDLVGGAAAVAALLLGLAVIAVLAGVGARRDARTVGGRELEG